MKLIKLVLGNVVTWVVVAVIGGFVVYALYFFQPTGNLDCSDSVVNQKGGNAIHDVRQWFGRNPDIFGCNE